MKKQNDIVLIGAGIMSATLGVLLHRLMPQANFIILERLDRISAESSDANNNAGTGHSAFCELNYTPEREDGTVDISKALRISESFEISKQFWSYLKKNKFVDPKAPFINDIDHMSFVWGDDNIAFLQKRYEAMTKYGMFKDMQYSDDKKEIESWIPLMMEGRDEGEALAVTRMKIGTDVNFGSVTRGMVQYLWSQENVQIKTGHEVQEINRKENGDWELSVKDLHLDKTISVESKFVFIGAGGGALSLLEKTNIPEGKGYGGFPVSGQFLVCKNKEIIKRHEAKVYGKAAEGSPPMSVPHLDTRMLNGVRSLLFGPFAGFSTKFLKNGSYLDLPLSIEMHNVWPMLAAGVHNIGLTKYLIEQVMQDPKERFAYLQKFYPHAKFEDWELVTAGQRVQIIKKDEEEGGVLKFGTEIVSNEDNTLAALLGASPGASTAVSIMLDVLNQCFADQMSTPEWQTKIKEMIPSYGQSLIEDDELCMEIRAQSSEVLNLV